MNPDSRRSEPSGLRLWPALVLLAVLWTLRYLPLLFAEPPLPVLMLAFFGPAVSVLLIFVWWVAGSRAAGREKLVGIGGLVELSSVDFRDGVIAVPFVWHAWEDLKLVAAPGIVMETEDGSDEAVLRAGGEYGFPLARGWEVLPALYFDFYSETVVVFGLSFALRF